MINPRSPAIVLVVAALVSGACLSCASTAPARAPQQKQLAEAIAPPQRLSSPEDLPGPVRALLKARMASHAQDMGGLTSAVMVLNYELVERRATAIADDATLARPLTGDATELNSALPERFFLLQDELRAAAKALAQAAAVADPYRVADAYGALSQTCVHCHAVYRQGR